jgi:hypothetical protein
MRTSTGLSLEELAEEIARKDPKLSLDQATKKAEEFFKAKETLRTGQKGIRAPIRDFVLGRLFSRGVASKLAGSKLFRSKKDTQEAAKITTDFKEQYSDILNGGKGGGGGSSKEDLSKIKDEVVSEINKLGEKTSKQISTIESKVGDASKDVVSVYKQLKDTSEDVKAIKERLSVKQIETGKGEKKQSYLYDPLAPEGKQVRVAGAGARFASKEGGATSEYSKVMNKAAFLGTQKPEPKAEPTAGRIPKADAEKEVISEMKKIESELAELRKGQEQALKSTQIGGVDDAQQEAKEAKKDEDEEDWRKKIDNKLDQILKEIKEVEKEEKEKGGGIISNIMEMLGARIFGKTGIKVLGKLKGFGKGVKALGGAIKGKAGKLLAGGAAAYGTWKAARAVKTAGEVAKGGAEVAAKGAEVATETAGKAGEKAVAEAAAKASGEVAAKEGAKEVGKEGVKAVGKETIKKVATKILGKTLGKTLVKSIPFLGAAAGLGFAAMKLVEGDAVGAGLEAVSGIGGPATAIPAAVASGARDVYQGVYGVYPEQDPKAGEKLGLVKDATTEAAAELVGKKMEPTEDKKKDEKPQAEAGKTPPPSKASEAAPKPTESQKVGGVVINPPPQSQTGTPTTGMETKTETIDEKLDDIKLAIAASAQAMIKATSMAAKSAVAASSGSAGEPSITVKLRNDEPSVSSYTAAIFDHPVNQVQFNGYTRVI